MLAVLILVVPFLELFVILQVSHLVGPLATIAILILVSISGSWLVRREGLNVFVKVQQELSVGRMPTQALVDGLLVLFGGVLLVTPGFLTDVVGLLLLAPPTRALFRPRLLRKFASHLGSVNGAAPSPSAPSSSPSASAPSPPRRSGPVIDVSEVQPDEPSER